MADSAEARSAGVSLAPPGATKRTGGQLHDARGGLGAGELACLGIGDAGRSPAGVVWQRRLGLRGRRPGLALATGDARHDDDQGKRQTMRAHHGVSFCSSVAARTTVDAIRLPQPR